MERPSKTREPEAGPSRPRIFITMPAYRAERTVGQTVADIPDGLAENLILVDDASPDRTVERARSLGIRVFVHSRNRGYGGNQKSCYSIALEQGADVVVLLHPDYQYDPKAVPLLIAPILAGDADMTFGSRFAGLGDPRSGGMPLYRYLGNRCTTVLENTMLKARFTEMHSGMRAYTRECLLALPFRGYSDDYVFDSQLLVDAVTSGQRVVEVPIPTRYTEESSSISVLRSLRYISGSLLYCAQQTWKKGRRGNRWPAAISSLRRGRPLGYGRPTAVDCPLCGANIRVSIQRDLIQCLNCGLVSADEESNVLTPAANMPLSVFAGYLARMTRFWLAGPKLAILGRNAQRLVLAARDRGWDAQPAREPHELSGRRWDAIFVEDLIADVPNPVRFLESVGQHLSTEGLLAVTCSNMIDGRTTLPGSLNRRHFFGSATLHATMRRAGLRTVDWIHRTRPGTPRDPGDPRALALSRHAGRTRP